MQNKSAIEQLSEIIDKYLTTKKYISLNRLSQLANVSEPTLRRIHKKEIKSMPNITTVINLLFQVDGMMTSEELISRYGGALEEYLKEELDVIEMNDLQLSLRKKVEEIIKEPIAFHIFALATTHCGVSESEVEDYFGLDGLRIIFHLFEHDYVELREGRFHAMAKKIKFAPNLINGIIEESSKLIDSQGDALQRENYYYHWTEALNFKAIEKVKRLEREHFHKLKEIFSDKKNLGEHHIFFFGAFDSYKKEGLKK